MAFHERVQQYIPSPPEQPENSQTAQTYANCRYHNGEICLVMRPPSEVRSASRYLAQPLHGCRVDL